MSSDFTLFLQAVDTGDDNAAEQAVSRLIPLHEAHLLKLSDDPSTDRRWWAIRALAEVSDEQALSHLLRALNDDDAGVRSVAIMALQKLHSRLPEATRPLLPILSERLLDPDGMVRQAATDALAKCGDDAIPILSQILQRQALVTDNEVARVRAAMALRRIATMSAAAVMYQCLNDANYLVHTYAYEGLDEMGLLDNVLLII
jgi:HEAT repeat protein